MCPTRHVMVIYYLHHRNFRCTVPLIYVSAGIFSGGDTMSKARNAAATKRNNRKIHARKFLVTPEGKALLAKKQEEREEIKLARAANNMF